MEAYDVIVNQPVVIDNVSLVINFSESMVECFFIVFELSRLFYYMKQ